MSNKFDPMNRDRWARLRFNIIGHLLAAPPAPGKLRAELKILAIKTWRHPESALDITFSFSSIERWYYEALRANDPVSALKNHLGVALL